MQNNENQIKLNTKKVFSVAIVLLVYSLFLVLFWPFKQAIFFAILFAFALNPLLNRLENSKKIKLSRVKSISVLVMGLIAVFFIPFSFIVSRVVGSIGKVNPDQVMQLPIIQKIQSVVSVVLEFAQNKSADFGFDLTQHLQIGTYASDLGRKTFDLIAGLATNLPSVLFQFIIFIMMLYYFLIQRHQFKTWIIKTELVTYKQINGLVQIFESVCYLVLVSTLVIAFLQASIVSLASFLVGYDDFFIIFMIAFFMSFVPVIGSGPLTLSLILYSFLNSQYGAAVVLIIAAGLAAVLDNIIKTYLFSSNKENSVNPIISLLTIIGALNVFGILGLFLGPVISQLALQIGTLFLSQE